MFNKKDQLVKRAKYLIHCADKVFNYRRDILSNEDINLLENNVKDIENIIHKKEKNYLELSKKNDVLYEFLLKIGGDFFPEKTLMGWVELIIVAAILAGGIRAFFIQPFKIPTNSMYPTYNGMTYEIIKNTDNEISIINKTFQQIFRSASFIKIDSNYDGEVLIPLSNEKGSIIRKTKAINGIMGGNDFYEIYVGENLIPVKVPMSFSFDSLVLDTFFPETKESNIDSIRWQKIITNSNNIIRNQYGIFIRTNYFVKRGESILNFKIFGGDMVIVDRFSYHFKNPSVGDPFVFKTKHIPGLNSDVYYIKRLAGKPGDFLKLEDDKLYRNRKLIFGADAFLKNNNKEVNEKYFGYLPECGGNPRYSVPLTSEIQIPKNYYYALGDNSANSYDSRGWGYVPSNDVIGKALFILYPFNNHWGLAK